MPSASKKRLSNAQRLARNAAQKKRYHEKKSQVIAARGIISKRVITAPIHQQAAAKRVLTLMRAQIVKNPNLNDFIIASYLLAKAVLNLEEL